MAAKSHDIDIQIGAEIEGVKIAFTEIRRQAAELRTQLRPTAEAMQEGFENLGRKTLPNVAAKAEVAAEKLRAQAKKIAAEIDGMDGKIEVDADVEPAKKALTDLRTHANRVAKQMKPATDAMGADFRRVGLVIGGVIKPITTLGKLMAGVSFAGAAAGAYALNDVIGRMRDTTMEVSSEIVRLQDALPIYSLTDPGIDTADALKSARAIEALFESFGMDQSDARGILPVLAMEAKAASDLVEGSLDKISLFNIRHSELFDEASGKLKNGEEQLVAWANAVERLDEDSGRRALMELLGDDDGVRALQILRMGGDELRKRLEYYKSLNDIRAGDVESSRALKAAASEEKFAWEQVGLAVQRGFVGPLENAIKRRTELAKGFRDEIGIASEIGGEFYQSVTDSVAEAGAEILSILIGIEDGSSPLENSLKRLAELIDIVMQGIVDLVRYLATGETDAPWLISLLERLDQLKNATLAAISVAKTAAGYIQELWGWIDSLLSLLGVEQTWAQVGVVAGLILFRGTIFSVISGVSALVGWIVRLTGATAALGSATKTAGAAASGFAGRNLGAAAKVGGGVAVGLTIVDDAEFMDKIRAILDRGNELGKTEGQAFAAGYIKSAVDELRRQEGDGFVMGWLNRVVDENLGTNIIPDFDEIELDVAMRVNVDNADEAAAGARAAFQELGDAIGWEVDKDGRVNLGGGLTISGAELQAGVLDDITAQLDGIPATIDVQAIRGLENYQLELPQIQAPVSTDGGPAIATPLQPVTIIVDGQRIEGIRVAPDGTEKLRQALQRTARARS